LTASTKSLSSPPISDNHPLLSLDKFLCLYYHHSRVHFLLPTSGSFSISICPVDFLFKSFIPIHHPLHCTINFHILPRLHRIIHASIPSPYPSGCASPTIEHLNIYTILPGASGVQCLPSPSLLLFLICKIETVRYYWMQLPKLSVKLDTT